MCDMSLSDYVKVEVYDVKGNKAVLNVNPVGQFNPGGCIAFISMKKDQVLPLKSGAEIYEFLLKKSTLKIWKSPLTSITTPWQMFWNIPKDSK